MSNIGIGVAEIVGTIILGLIFLGGVYVGVKVVGYRLRKKLADLEKKVEALDEDYGEDLDELEVRLVVVEEKTKPSKRGQEGARDEANRP